MSDDLDWEDCCCYFYVGASIAQGDGYWPSLVNIDATDLSGSVTSGCARRLAAMLVRAADACDVSTEAVMPK
jgi:hypothetical protein